MSVQAILFRLFAAITVLLCTFILLRYLAIWDHAYSEQPPSDDAKSGLPPNVIFIFADDLGFNDVGYHGKEHGSLIETPTLDRLAAGGVKLENYYVQPICTPSRSQLLSGRYQIHTGLQHAAIYSPQRSCLPLDEVTLPQLLQRRGYATSMVGKWHVGFYQDACTPTERGFDSFFGYLIAREEYFSHDASFMVYNHTMYGYDLYRDKTPVPQYKGQYSTHVFTEKAIEVINNHDGNKPLFLYLAYQAVHQPLEVPGSYMEQYAHIADADRRAYAGMVTCMDEGVANVTEALKKAGLYDNTVIVFSTDNGGGTDNGGNNWPLRGNKTTLWEGGVRGVGFVHSPILPESVRGTINRDLIHVSDWLPTIVAGMAGGSVNGTKPLDGFNVWDSIRGRASSPRHEILHNIDPLLIAPTTTADMSPLDSWMWTRELSQRILSVPRFDRFNASMQAALRVGDWKIQTGLGEYGCWIPPPESNIPTVCPRSESQKRIWLFNITTDPLEKTDLSEEYPAVVEQLLNRLDEYYQDSVPVRFPLPDMVADPGLRNGVWGPWL